MLSTVGLVVAHLVVGALAASAALAGTGVWTPRPDQSALLAAGVSLIAAGAAIRVVEENVSVGLTRTASHRWRGWVLPVGNVVAALLWTAAGVGWLTLTSEPRLLLAGFLGVSAAVALWGQLGAASELDEFAGSAIRVDRLIQQTVNEIVDPFKIEPQVRLLDVRRSVVGTRFVTVACGDAVPLTGQDAWLRPVRRRLAAGEPGPIVVERDHPFRPWGPHGSKVVAVAAPVGVGPAYGIVEIVGRPRDDRHDAYVAAATAAADSFTRQLVSWHDDEE